VLVDINYPTTIIFDNATYVNYQSQQAWLGAAPYYLAPFYVPASSETYLLYSKQSSITNVVLCGFRVRGVLATDNLCLDNGIKSYCYSSIFVDVAQLQNNFWFYPGYYPNMGGILGIGYFVGSTEYGSFWENMLN
jgi:hypothetical protein